MRSTLALTLALALAAGALSGCGRNNPAAPGPSQSVDQAEVAYELARQPQVVDDQLADSPDQTSLDGPAGAAALIHPLTYWRTITRVDRSFVFAFADTDSTGRPTTAVVTVLKNLHGSFNILTGVPGGDGTPLDSANHVIRKPLDDRWVRRVLLKRVPPDPAAGMDAGDPGRDARRWRVAATSGVKVTSRDATTHILSLQIQSGPLDTLITDPLALFRLRRVLKLQPGTEVTLTVTTERNDDVVVLMHHDRRFRLHNNGDNTYTGVWRAGLFADGVWHFGVNALSNGTLFDDRAPYDSRAWILPYVMAPTEMADYMP
jgi:hypothetical protein